MDKIIGKNIKALRETLGYTQQAVADYLGINRVELSYYEGGTRTIPSEKLTKLAALYSVDEYDLYEENEMLLKTNLAFAFRAENLTNEDLTSIASFKKIATNYLKMQKALANE
ncbi:MULTISPECIES: helix-turn-helix domain-containing protein [Chryseobacterium]|uniref:helix-turn-helix domain-containing protein n=1 Tax=Chryseobacterium sp. R2A-55 TaxID=2744445 RepID=UPI001F2A9345|nr:helix-turn-helix transcriptional regulator [Chryseobacterium sp. R2A-55]